MKNVTIFYNPIDEIRHQNYYVHTLENGDVILNVENKRIISNGEFNKSSIECIIEFLKFSDKIEEAKDYFYEGTSNERTIWKVVKNINEILQEKVATFYGRNNSTYYRNFRKQRENDNRNREIDRFDGRRTKVPDGIGKNGLKYSITIYECSSN